MFKKTKQFIQTHGVAIGAVTGVAMTYTVMRKFDLDVSQVRKMAYEQGFESGQVDTMVETLWGFIQEKGLESELSAYSGWALHIPAEQLKA